VSNEIIPAESRVPSEYVANVGTMLSLAIEKGIDADSLGKLVALQERVLEKQAKDEFFAAMAQFHAECPVIGKNRTAKVQTKTGGSYDYQYADLAMVADTIKPLLDKHGFSYSFQQKFGERLVETVCVVRHAAGHCEETTFSGPWESTAGMSAMQKAVAATTTARRLALILAFGLSVGEDNDGRGSLPPEHENPSRNEQAPKNQPRGQRETPVTAADVKQFTDLWKSLHPKGSSDDLKVWCAEATGFEFNPLTTSAWTRSLLQQALNAAKEEQEVRQ